MITVDDLADRQSTIFDPLKRKHADLDGYAHTIRSLIPTHTDIHP